MVGISDWTSGSKVLSGKRVLRKVPKKRLKRCSKTNSSDRMSKFETVGWVRRISDWTGDYRPKKINSTGSRWQKSSSLVKILSLFTPPVTGIHYFAAGFSFVTIYLLLNVSFSATYSVDFHP